MLARSSGLLFALLERHTRMCELNPNIGGQKANTHHPTILKVHFNIILLCSKVTLSRQVSRSRTLISDIDNMLYEV
jgi:hypothetical protein